LQLVRGKEQRKMPRNLSLFVQVAVKGKQGRDKEQEARSFRSARESEILKDREGTAKNEVAYADRICASQKGARKVRTHRICPGGGGKEMEKKEPGEKSGLPVPSCIF